MTTSLNGMQEQTWLPKQTRNLNLNERWTGTNDNLQTWTVKLLNKTYGLLTGVDKSKIVCIKSPKLTKFYPLMSLSFLFFISSSLKSRNFLIIIHHYTESRLKSMKRLKEKQTFIYTVSRFQNYLKWRADNLLRCFLKFLR